MTLVDAVPGRAGSLAQRLQPAFSGLQLRAATTADPGGHALVVQATPLGLAADDPLPLDVDRLDAGAVVIDILMKNQPTPLVRAVRARGGVAHPGHEMLVQQVPEYLAFFGYPALAAQVRADPAVLRALLAPH